MGNGLRECLLTLGIVTVHMYLSVIFNPRLATICGQKDRREWLQNWHSMAPVCCHILCHLCFHIRWQLWRLDVATYYVTCVAAIDNYGAWMLPHTMSPVLPQLATMVPGCCHILCHLNVAKYCAWMLHLECTIATPPSDKDGTCETSWPQNIIRLLLDYDLELEV